MMGMGGGGGGGGGFEGGFQYLPRDVVLREHHGTAVTADYSDTLSREGNHLLSKGRWHRVSRQ
jgi:hypothetical protein